MWVGAPGAACELIERNRGTQTVDSPMVVAPCRPCSACAFRRCVSCRPLRRWPRRRGCGGPGLLPPEQEGQPAGMAGPAPPRSSAISRSCCLEGQEALVQQPVSSRSSRPWRQQSAPRAGTSRSSSIGRTSRIGRSRAAAACEMQGRGRRSMPCLPASTRSGRTSTAGRERRQLGRRSRRSSGTPSSRGSRRRCPPAARRPAPPRPPRRCGRARGRARRWRPR